MHSLAVIFACIRRVSPIHHTHHPSHAFISIPAFDTPDDWGSRGGVAAAAAAAAAAGAGATGAGAISVLGTIWRRGPTPPICFGPFHPRSSAPVGRTHSQAKPTLAWPPRLVSTLPATNLPLETRHTCTSGSAFSHLGSARDPRLVT